MKLSFPSFHKPTTIVFIREYYTKRTSKRGLFEILLVQIGTEKTRNIRIKNRFRTHPNHELFRIKLISSYLR